MLIEHIESLYRREAEKINSGPRNVFRASSAGYCERRLGYDKLGIKGDALQPRRMAVLKHGNIIDRALKDDLKLALGDKFLNLDDLPINRLNLDGVTITFTPDGAFQADNGE